MAKTAKKAGNGGPPVFDRGREYIVYWQTGLKSRCSGYPLNRAVSFYLSRARLIVDAETHKPVYTAE